MYTAFSTLALLNNSWITSRWTRCKRVASFSNSQVWSMLSEFWTRRAEWKGGDFWDRSPWSLIYRWWWLYPSINYQPHILRKLLPDFWLFLLIYVVPLSPGNDSSIVIQHSSWWNLMKQSSGWFLVYLNLNRSRDFIVSRESAEDSAQLSLLRNKPCLCHVIVSRGRDDL